MSLFRLLAHRSVQPKRPGRLQVETLETRTMPAVDLLAIPNSDMPSNKPLFVPVTATSDGGAIDYTVSSTNPSITSELVTGGRSLRLTVSGKDSNALAFNGTLTLRLFENIAPLAIGNIIALVNSGYYNGKEFHRVVNDFVIQGGSPTGDGTGGSASVTDAPDEYNPLYTFASRGILAMATAGDDNNNAQFFITDPFIVSTGNEVPAPLDRRSQFLNFNHSIVGILTSGFDTFQTIMDVPKVLGSDGAISSPITDVVIENATVINTDPRNALLKISSVGGFLGSADITVTGTEGTSTQSKTFTVTSVPDNVNDRPFLGSVDNVSTSLNKSVSFVLPFTELDVGDAQTFVVGRVINTANGPVFTTIDPNLGTASVDVNGKVTITPAPGFSGSFNLKVGVRDAQDRIGSSLQLNDARNFDTQQITVFVVPNAPTISDIANQTSNGGSVGPVGFTIGDVETSAADLTLTATSSNPSLLPTANIVFGGSGANRTITLTTVAGQFGTSSITVTVTDADNATASETFAINVSMAGSGPNPKLVGYREFAVGADVGGSQATLYNADTSPRFTVAPYGTGFTGGIRTAAGDFTGDGVADLVVASGPGRAGNVRIFDGVTQTQLFDLVPFGEEFNRGIVVSAGDITGDGKTEVVISAESGGGARLRIFSPTATGFQQITDFIGLIGSDGIADGTFRGGARTAVSDINGDGFGDLIFAAGASGGPRIAIFNGATLGLNGGPKLRGDFFAFEPNLRDGTYVAAGDFNGDGLADLVAGAGPGGGPRVSIFNGFDLLNNKQVKLKDFFAGDVNNRSGIRVAVKNLDNDAQADLVVGTGPDNGTTTGYTGVALLPAVTPVAAFAFEAFPGFSGGVFVG